jgi:hypothetical protein
MTLAWALTDVDVTGAEPRSHPGPHGRSVECGHVERGEKLVEGAQRLVKCSFWTSLAPLGLNLGDGLSCTGEQCPALFGWMNQFGAPVERVGSTLEITEILQIVDEFGACGKTEVGALRELGQSDPVDPDIAPDRHVREPQPRKAFLAIGLGVQLPTEVVEQADQQLTDGEPVGGEYRS